MLCLWWPKFSMYFLIFHGVKIKITHSIVPINLQSSANVTGVSRCPNVCPIVLSSSNLFLETSRQLWTQHYCNLVDGVSCRQEQTFRILSVWEVESVISYPSLFILMAACCSHLPRWVVTCSLPPPVIKCCNLFLVCYLNLSDAVICTLWYHVCERLYELQQKLWVSRLYSDTLFCFKVPNFMYKFISALCAV